MCFIHQYAETHEIEMKTHRLFLAINKNIELEEQLFYITFSMGISIFPDHASDYLSLSIKSDTAMFRSKELGKDQYTFYSQTMENISSNFLKLTSRIRNAIENNLFVFNKFKSGLFCDTTLLCPKKSSRVFGRSNSASGTCLF